MEQFPNGCPHPVLKIGQYPLPIEAVKTLAADCDELVVLEEGYPLIEEALTGLLDSRWVVRGRKDGLLPRTGELNPDHVGVALGFPAVTEVEVPEQVRMRPPSLCTGCGHRDVFEALQVVYKEKADDCRIFGDIGCYTLGYLPPFRAMHACVDMGASITMAKGAADAGLKYPVAVIGDSTFTHSGMTSLLDAINERSRITVIISDNETTGMTGGQQSAGTGKLEAICQGLGVEPDHLHVLVPLKKNFDQMVDLLRREMAYDGVSVIIPRRECIQTLSRKKRS
jgi:indolepyruvate ferredoxin oxidoreductase alpha subunit